MSKHVKILFYALAALLTVSVFSCTNPTSATVVKPDEPTPPASNLYGQKTPLEVFETITEPTYPYSDDRSIAVVEIDWTRFTKGFGKDDLSQRWALLLSRMNKSWINDRWQSWFDPEAGPGTHPDWKVMPRINDQEGKYIVYNIGRDSLQEKAIRPDSAYAYNTAITLITDLYREENTGVDINTAVKRTITWIKSLANAHKNNKPSGYPGVGWGNHWQSTMWAGESGAAAWMLWDYLEDKDRENVRIMVESEANSRMYKTAPVANANMYNDSKSEELGWDAFVLELACVMMPNHPFYDAWRERAIEYRINMSTRKIDKTNSAVFDGKAVKDWYVGYNVGPEGILGNHGFYPSPSYSTATTEQQMIGALYWAMGDKEIPQANFFNMKKRYETMTKFEWSEPDAFGGTSRTIMNKDGSTWWPLSGAKEKEAALAWFDWAAMSSMIRVSLQGDLDVSIYENVYLNKYLAEQEKQGAEGGWTGGVEKDLQKWMYIHGHRIASAVWMQWLDYNDQYEIPFIPENDTLPPAPSFDENGYQSFENESLDFGNWEVSESLVSDEQARTGTKSIKLSKSGDVLGFAFPEAQNKVFQFWIYDDVDKTPAKFFFAALVGTGVKDLQNHTRDDGIAIAEDLSLTEVAYRNNPSKIEYKLSTVKREAKWKRVTYDFTGDKEKVAYIDGVEVYRNTEESFDRVLMGCTFGKAPVVYIDDIKVFDTLKEANEAATK